jgi:hypothetical protein
MHAPPGRTVGLLLAAAMAVAACGASGSSSGAPARDAGSRPEATGPGPTATVPMTAAAQAPGSTTDRSTASPLPAVDVTDVATGGTVQLASLLPADRPLLVWMWAPH